MSSTGKQNNARKIPTVVKDQKLVARRRRQIADAAVGMFIEKGFHKTTTREMAKAAGISIGSLYEYVQNKEDVLYLVCEAIHQEMEDSLKAPGCRQRGRGQGPGGGHRGLYRRVRPDGPAHHAHLPGNKKSWTPDARRYVLEHELRITAMFTGLLQRGVEDYSLRPLNRGELELMAHNIMIIGHMWAFRRWALAKIGLQKYIDDQTALIMGQLV